VTIIGIHCCDSFKRPGYFNISLKGQVSENDAVELIKVLDSKKLLPKNAKGNYSLQDYNARQAMSLGEKIRQETANYFNNLSINAGANAEAKPNITPQRSTRFRL